MARMEYPASVETNSTLQQGAPALVVVSHSGAPNIIVRILWFLLLGMWLGTLVTFVGYLFCLTVIGLPIGLMILNRLPAIMTLRPASNNVRITTSGNTTIVTFGVRQQPFLLRALYFLFIGWWVGGIWISVAWFLSMIWIFTFGLSLAPAFLMFDRIPAVLTLRRN